jgi:hypothetical protein
MWDGTWFSAWDGLWFGTTEVGGGGGGNPNDTGGVLVTTNGKIPKVLPQEVVEAVARCACCPGGSGSGGRLSYNCAQANDCLALTTTTVFGSVEVGGCSVVVEHGTNPVDPDPPQWLWFPPYDPTVVGFGSYYEYQDGAAYTGGCGVDQFVNYSVICVDRTDSSSKFAVIAWYTDGVDQWFYYIDSFEAISCDPLYIDTGVVNSTDPSGGPSFRLVLTS